MEKMKIKDLGAEYKLITDSQEITDLAASLGIIDLQVCCGLYVKLSKWGDCIDAVYGFEGVVPHWIRQLPALLTLGK